MISLLSSGLDSTVNLAMAMARGEMVRLVITFDYGQLAAEREIDMSARIADFYQIPHKIIKLDWFNSVGSSALTKPNQLLPILHEDELNDVQKTWHSATAVWVPNRNGVFINIAAAWAEGLGVNKVLTGFNAEEAATFPDNSEEFIDRTNAVLQLSTKNSVKVICYTAHMNKKEIVDIGRDLKVPFELVWSCYRGGDAHCGICESCLRFTRAMRIEQGVKT